MAPFVPKFIRGTTGAMIGQEFVHLLSLTYARAWNVARSVLCFQMRICAVSHRRLQWNVSLILAHGCAVGVTGEPSYADLSTIQILSEEDGSGTVGLTDQTKVCVVKISDEPEANHLSDFATPLPEASPPSLVEANVTQGAYVIFLDKAGRNYLIPREQYEFAVRHVASGQVLNMPYVCTGDYNDYSVGVGQLDQSLTLTTAFKTRVETKSLGYSPQICDYVWSELGDYKITQASELPRRLATVRDLRA